MSYYPEPDSNIRDNVKVVLDLPNYATKKELEHATGADTSDLATNKDFIALKYISKLINFTTSLNNLKTKVDHLDVAKFKTGPVDLKKVSDVEDNERSNKNTHTKGKSKQFRKVNS